MTMRELRVRLHRLGNPTFFEEDLIRQDERGVPELADFDRPLQHYIDMHRQWADYLGGNDFSEVVATRAYKARVYGTYGLIAKGEEAVPYALSLLTSKVSDYREDAAGILRAFEKHPEVVSALIRATEEETDLVALSALLVTLGRLKAREAIPVVARILREGNADTQWDAAEALGRISGKRFGSKPDRVAKALAWLEEQNL
ncbi:hypothetical protein EON82_05725 [bacterium]|nr:MAG: hypothetical protein EON82_05725 [bacterium]